MSNTGRNKKLASFNCDEHLWENFKHRCQEEETTATAVLTQFIKRYVDNSLDDLDLDPLDKREKERVRACVDEYLGTHRGGWKELHSKVTALSEKVAFLEGQLTAYSSRSNTKSSTFKQEREFWFIPDRARYLGLSISG